MKDKMSKIQFAHSPYQNHIFNNKFICKLLEEMKILIKIVLFLMLLLE